MSETKKKHQTDHEIQLRRCRAEEERNRILKMILIVLEKRLSGQIFSDFSAEAELKAREKANKK